RAERRIEVIPIASLPKDLVVQPELEARMDVADVVETVLIDAMGRIDDLDARLARAIEQALQVCFQIESFDHRPDLAGQLAVVGHEVVQNIDKDKRSALRGIGAVGHRNDLLVTQDPAASITMSALRVGSTSMTRWLTSTEMVLAPIGFAIVASRFGAMALSLAAMM